MKLTFLTNVDQEELETKITEVEQSVEEFVETDPTVPAWAKAANKPTYTASEVGALPDTTVIPTVPTNVSAFTNDAGYLTQHQSLAAYAKTADLGDLATKDSLTAAEVGLGNVDNVKQYSASNPPPYPVTSVNGKTGAVTVSVPTKVSQLQNDSGYLTQHQDISGKLDVSALPTAINTALSQAKASGEFDGKNGTSVTVSNVTESTADGGSNVVAFSDGKTLTVKNGKTGAPGKAPVKGVDYFTDTDKAEMVNSVLAALPTWTGGSY